MKSKLRTMLFLKRNVFILLGCVCIGVVVLLLLCTPADTAESGSRTIVTTFFPLSDFTRNIVGDEQEVISLIPAGIDPHDYSPSPADVRLLEQAGAFVVLGLEFASLEERLISAVGDIVTIHASAGIPTLAGRGLGASEDEDGHDGDEHAHDKDEHDEHAHAGHAHDEHDEHDEHAHDEHDKHDEHAHDKDAHAHDKDAHAHDKDEHAHDKDEHDEHAHDKDEHDEHAHDEHAHDEHAHDEHDKHDEHAHDKDEHAHDKDEHDEHAHDKDEHDEHAHAGHAHDIDPHIWMSVDNARTMVRNITEGLTAAYPEYGDRYRANAARYLDILADAKTEFQQTLQGCVQDTILVTHDAYRYLAQEYNFNTISIYGVEPGGDTSSQRLVSLIESARANNIRYIFYEPVVSPRVPETIAAEIGVTLLELYPLEYSVDNQTGYVGQMKANIRNISIALECPERN